MNQSDIWGAFSDVWSGFRRGQKIQERSHGGRSPQAFAATLRPLSASPTISFGIYSSTALVRTFGWWVGCHGIETRGLVSLQVLLSSLAGKRRPLPYFHHYSSTAPLFRETSEFFDIFIEFNIVWWWCNCDSNETRGLVCTPSSVAVWCPLSRVYVDDCPTFVTTHRLFLCFPRLFDCYDICIGLYVVW